MQWIFRQWYREICRYTINGDICQFIFTWGTKLELGIIPFYIVSAFRFFHPPDENWVTSFEKFLRFIWHAESIFPTGS